MNLKTRHVQFKWKTDIFGHFKMGTFHGHSWSNRMTTLGRDVGYEKKPKFPKLRTLLQNGPA